MVIGNSNLPIGFKAKTAALLRLRITKIIIVFIVLACIVYFVLAVFIWKVSSDPRKVSNNFLTACIENRVGEAYELANYEFQSTISRSNFERLCTQLEDSLSDKPKMYNSIVVAAGNQSAAAVVYEASLKPDNTIAKSADATNLYIKVKTVKNLAGEWDVQRIFVDTTELSSSLKDQ